MNVRVRSTCDGVTTEFVDAEVSWDTYTLQVVHGAETTTFPLVNVDRFTTSESVTP